MAKASWYYAEGDKQQGPISAAQLKELINSNKFPPEGLVFQEGMKQWTPANQVKGLVSQAAPAPAAPAPAAPRSEPEPTLDVQQESVTKKSKKRSGSARDVSGMLLGYGRIAGIPLLFAGIILVVCSKGCDSLGQKGVDRAKAKESYATSTFDDEWKQKLDDEDDSGKKTELRKDRDKKREKLEKGAWRDLRQDARNASNSNTMASYWREMFFVLGTIVLSVGLLFVGFTGEGADRWICLIMLAIITFSIYVGGFAWISLPSFR